MTRAFARTPTAPNRSPPALGPAALPLALSQRERGALSAARLLRLAALRRRARFICRRPICRERGGLAADRESGLCRPLSWFAWRRCFAAAFITPRSSIAGPPGLWQPRPAAPTPQAPNRPAVLRP